MEKEAESRRCRGPCVRRRVSLSERLIASTPSDADAAIPVEGSMMMWGRRSSSFRREREREERAELINSTSSDGNFSVLPTHRRGCRLNRRTRANPIWRFFFFLFCFQEGEFLVLKVIKTRRRRRGGDCCCSRKTRYKTIPNLRPAKKESYCLEMPGNAGARCCLFPSESSDQSGKKQKTKQPAS